MLAPKVSVLLTTYNRPAMLAKAVTSVLAQTLEDFELLILDDGSDDPAQVAFLYSVLTDPRVRVIVFDVTPAERVATARYATKINTGLRIARGEYISYLCDDDYYLPERLERMAAYLDERPEIQVVYGSQQTYNLQDGVLVPSHVPPRRAIPKLEDAAFKVDHSSVMMRKSLVDTIGDWDDAPEHWPHADAVYWRKINQAGYAFYGIDEILDVHVYHENAYSHNQNWRKQAVST